MAAPTYATRDDLYRLGISAAALQPVERTVEQVDPVTDRIVLRGHGLAVGDRLRLFSKSSTGQPGGTSASVPYDVAVVSEDVFELRSGAATVDITTAGTAPVLVVVDPRPAIEKALYTESRWVDENATAHAPPFEPDAEGAYPATIVDCVCKRAAVTLAVVRGLLHPAYKESAEGIERRATEATQALFRWLRGKPIEGAKDATPSRADNGAAAGSIDSVGEAADWGSYL